MLKRDLYKLRKTELLQIIYEQKKQINILKDENNNLLKELDNKMTILKDTGSIAEITLQINKIFEDAKLAANECLNNVQKIDVFVNTDEEAKDDIVNSNSNAEKDFGLIPVNMWLVKIKISLFKKIQLFLLIIINKFKIQKLKIKQKKFLKKRKINLDNYDLSVENIKKELKKQKNKDIKINFAKTSTYYIIVIIAITIIMVTRIFNVIVVNGNSMEPTLISGDLLIVTKIFGYKKGDIVAFYYNNSILLKRIIATSGDVVNIDDEGNVFVNSEKLEEEYINNLSYGNCNITFPFQVPDKEIFVLGDNRESSIDSRNKSIGSISEDKILGKIIVNINQLVIY